MTRMDTEFEGRRAHTGRCAPPGGTALGTRGAAPVGGAAGSNAAGHEIHPDHTEQTQTAPDRPDRLRDGSGETDQIRALYDPGRMQRLWLAVLVENVNVALGFGARSSQVFSKRADLSQKSAELWLGSEDFDIICDLVGIDPAIVLAEVETLRAAGLRFEVEVWG